MLCVAKGLAGGSLPVAATLATEPIFEAFLGPPEEGKTFFHGHTYTGNALGCAAAIANLDAFEQDQVLAGLPPRIRTLQAALDALRGPHVEEIRQKGLMAGVVLRHDHPPETRHAHRVCMAARALGVIVRPLGDVVVIMPPLAMPEDQIIEIVNVVGRAIQTT